MIFNWLPNDYRRDYNMMMLDIIDPLTCFLEPRDIVNLHLISSLYLERLKGHEFPRCVIAFIKHFFKQGMFSPLTLRSLNGSRVRISISRCYPIVGWTSLAYPPFLYEGCDGWMKCCQRYLKGFKRFPKKYISNYANEYVVKVYLPKVQGFKDSEEDVLSSFFKCLLEPKNEHDTFIVPH